MNNWCYGGIFAVNWAKNRLCGPKKWEQGLIPIQNSCLEGYMLNDRLGIMPLQTTFVYSEYELNSLFSGKIKSFLPTFEQLARRWVIFL
jgi:hypothetical protein